MTHSKCIFATRVSAIIIAVVVVFGMTPMFGGQVQAAAKKPGKVMIKTLALDNGSQFTVKWKKAKRASKYQVYVKKGSAKWKKVKTTKARSYKMKAAYNTKYSFKVRAIKGKKKGKFSAVMSMKTNGKPKVTYQSIKNGSATGGNNSTGNNNTGNNGNAGPGGKDDSTNTDVSIIDNTGDNSGNDNTGGNSGNTGNTGDNSGNDNTGGNSGNTGNTGDNSGNDNTGDNSGNTGNTGDNSGNDNTGDNSGNTGNTGDNSGNDNTGDNSGSTDVDQKESIKITYLGQKRTPQTFSSGTTELCTEITVRIVGAAGKTIKWHRAASAGSKEIIATYSSATTLTSNDVDYKFYITDSEQDRYLFCSVEDDGTTVATSQIIKIAGIVDTSISPSIAIESVQNHVNYDFGKDGGSNIRPTTIITVVISGGKGSEVKWYSLKEADYDSEATEKTALACSIESNKDFKETVYLSESSSAQYIYCSFTDANGNLIKSKIFEIPARAN